VPMRVEAARVGWQCDGLGIRKDHRLPDRWDRPGYGDDRPYCDHPFCQGKMHDARNEAYRTYTYHDER
jgi:hypothetical protein